MLAIALPDSLGPYAVLLAVGFLVGWYGHGARSNWIVAFGIVVILAAIGAAAAGHRHAQRGGTDRFLSLRWARSTSSTSRKKLSQGGGGQRLEPAWTRLTQLRLTLGGLIGGGELGPPVCVLFEGWDASGKGGAIKRLVAPLDPRHVRVVQFAAPTHDEKRHHFLWRFWPALPGWGGMAVFDRSWYGRVLVERVEGFATASSGCAPTTRSTASSASLADEGMILSSSGCTSPPRSSSSASRRARRTR